MRLIARYVYDKFPKVATEKAYKDKSITVQTGKPRDKAMRSSY